MTSINTEAMKQQELRKILRGKCISDESCEAAISELLNLYNVSNCKKTRADRRNDKAELIGRFSREQLVKYGGVVDHNKLSDLVLDWLKYSVKRCYKPL